MAPTARRASTAAFCLTAALVAVAARAQVRVGDDGRALDANPRVGSGGYNSPGYIPPVQVTGNQIVTGNVTDGRYFRGDIPYTDPREFRGTTGSGSFDRFIANSSSSLPDAGGALSIPRPRPFYGSRLAAPLPGDYTPLGATGAYVAVPRTEPQNNLIQAIRSDLLVANPALAPRVGDMVLSAPLDQQGGQANLLVASPLLGVRSLRVNDPADRSFLASYTGVRADDALARLRLDASAIDRMRQELVRSGTAEADVGSAARNLARPLPQPLETPENPALSGKRLADDVTPRNMGDRPAQPSLEWRLASPVPPAQQSAQYAELQRRLDRYYVDRLKTDEDRNREFLRQLRAREGADKARQKEPLVPPDVREQPPVSVVPDYHRISRAILGASSTPGVSPRVPTLAPTTRPAPLKIESLAVGVRAQGLADLLRKAEGLMKEGKYLAAVDQYEAAEQVAPNNGMVLLGKAHAELAAAYYKKAETHLREALLADPVLMMAQFDLKAVIDQPRLETLVRDLKELARRHETDPGPAFLLAYLAYNTGNEAQAATYLDLAATRAGGKDDLFRLLKVHWAVASQP